VEKMKFFEFFSQVHIIENQMLWECFEVIRRCFKVFTHITKVCHHLEDFRTPDGGIFYNGGWVGWYCIYNSLSSPTGKMQRQLSVLLFIVLKYLLYSQRSHLYFNYNTFSVQRMMDRVSMVNVPTPSFISLFIISQGSCLCLYIIIIFV
jgi:hypothetical protein